MRALLISLLAIAATGCASQESIIASPAELVRGIEEAKVETPAAPPMDAPRAAVFITECHQIVTAIIVTHESRVLFFDSHSLMSAEDLKMWAARSEQPALVKDLGCREFGLVGPKV